MAVLLAGGLTGLLNQSSAQVIDGSLKFGVGRLTRTLSSGANQKTWTWSSWVKRGESGSSHLIFDTKDATAGTPRGSIAINDSNRFRVAFNPSGNSWTVAVSSNALLRDLGSSWYHLVVSCDTTQSSSSNRIRLYINGVQVTDLNESSYPSENQDLPFNQNDNHTIGASETNALHLEGFLSQFYFIDGQALGPGYFGFTDPLTNTWRPKKFRAEGTTANDGRTWSDSSNLTNITNGAGAFDGDLTGGNYAHATGAGNSGTINFSNLTSVSTLRLYAREDNREASGKITVNSTDFDFPTTASWVDVSSALSGGLSSITLKNGDYLTALFAIEVDGIVLRNGITTNLAFGTNGFYLPMDNDDFNIDKSGKGNNWTAVNFSGTSIDPDVLKDSPSGAVSGGRAQTGITTTSSAPSNYATLNPLQQSLNRTPTLSDGNLTVSLSSGSSEWTNTGCTMNIGSGKYYWEVQFTTINGTIARIGVADSDDYEFNRNTSSTGLPWLGSGTGTSWSLDVGGNTLHNGSTVNSSYTSTITTSDAIGVLLDLDNNTLSYSKNGTNLGVAHSNVTSDFVTPGFGLHGATTNTISVNFGQKPFKYPPPAGYKLLNAADLKPETVITRPDQYVGVTTYTGNGTGQSINTGQKPDFVWIKNRDDSTSHMLFDSVRGVQKVIYSNANTQELPAAISVTAFNRDGFTVSSANEVNGSSDDMVAWTWKAGGNKNTFNVDDVGYASAAAAGLDGGNINPTGASVGTRQGFSIIKYTGTGNSSSTLSHGLINAPQFMIIKNLTDAENWFVWHHSYPIPDRNGFYLDLTANIQNFGSTSFSSTLPSSSVITLSTNNILNGSGDQFVAYVWHDVPGVQKFGSYVGNGNDDGPFVEIGFRPAILWIKDLTTNGELWCAHDSKRDPINPAKKRLELNGSGAEDASQDARIKDFLSNGFKIRGTSGEQNTNGDTYIYMAWAEAPSFNLYGGQSNAR